MRRRDFIKSICSAAVALGLVPALAFGQTTRTISLVNACNFAVFPGATSGAVAPERACPCGTGQTCNKDNNLCYWEQLTTTKGTPLDAYHLRLASGATEQVTIPIASANRNDNVWTGGVWPGTDFGSGPSRTAATAATGYCTTSHQGQWTIIPCAPFSGPQNAPLTRAEFALVNSTDFYDISAIHGANIPLSMEPTPGQNLNPVPSSADPNQKYYWCTAPGSVSKPPTAACDWSFAGTNNDVGMALVQHQPSPTLCGGLNQSCPRGQVCGIAYDSSKGVAGLYQECGTPISGTWSAIQICTAINYDNGNLKPDQVSDRLKNSLVCGSGITSPNGQLFSCSGENAKTCYHCEGAACDNCCGCPAWPAEYKPSGGNSKASDRCVATNKQWEKVSYPWLSYMKRGCPAAYSYQFDDVTATFTCSTATQINATNYTITFCPSNKVVQVGSQPPQ